MASIWSSKFSVIPDRRHLVQVAWYCVWYHQTETFFTIIYFLSTLYGPVALFLAPPGRDLNKNPIHSRQNPTISYLHLTQYTSRLGTNLVRGSVFFGCFGRFEVRFWRMNLGSRQVRGSEFSGSFQYQMEIYPFFDILCSKNLVFSLRFSLFLGGSKVWSSVSEDKPRFGRFKVRFS